MIKQFSFLSIFTFLLLISCSKEDKSRTASEYLSAYMKENKSVVLFGRVDAKEILEKCDYQHIPKASVLLMSEVKQYESALELSQGVCFALEGPFEKDGTPSRLVAFVKVKDVDSLANKITSMGLMLQEENDMRYVQNKDVTIGVKEEIAVFIAKKGKYDGKTSLEKVFKNSEGDVSNGKIALILKQQADIIMGVSLQNLYATSNTSISALSEVKQKEFKALTDDSYIQSWISFEKGQAVFESKNLFSNELMNRMFFKEDPQADIINRLGKGDAKLGISMNIDVEKLESFLDDFAPEFKRDLIRFNFQLQLMMSILGDDRPLMNLLGGNLGLVMVGDAMKDGSFVPQANIYLGLGDKGKEVSERLQKLFPKDKEIYDMKVDITEKGISVVSGRTKETKLTLPDFSGEFGKKGLTAFVNFEGQNMRSLDLQKGAKVIYAFKSVIISMDNQGSKMIIKGKNQHQNILKQVVDVYINDLEKSIQEIN